MKMKPARALRIRSALDEILQDFVENDELTNDAIEPALRYQDPRDKEFAAFICAVFAYGKVDLIKKSVHRILDPLQDEPVKFILSLSERDIAKMYTGFKHRFNNEVDLQRLLIWLRQVYLSHESLENFVSPTFEMSASDCIETLVTKLSQLSSKPLKKPEKGSSFWFLLPKPSTGSACKRFNLFLRWMVGTGPMDFSLWKKFSKSNLIIPVDVHVMEQSLKLGFTSRKNADWKTAEEITKSLKCLDPEDPTRFDFALCHIGINKIDLKI
jgi:uncharacterized protein (TIGR02757 family)